MPLIGMLHLLIAISFAVHAMKSGRPQFWVWIIMAVPLAGSLAYVLMELMPEMAHTRRARQIKSDLTDLVAPEREWHRRREQAELTGSIDDKRSLAEECERKGMWRDAIELYRSCAKGAFADDPPLLVGLARCELAQGEPKAALDMLDRLQTVHPKIESQEAHLLYARCLDALGRTKEAEAEYVNVSGYFIGLEARARLALLLQKTGEPQRANGLFQEIVKAAAVRGVVLSDADKDWLKVARSNL